jgi:16S rRNA (cytosine967-C5)-methyltransferase
VRELVFGTLRSRGRLDTRLAAFVRPGLDSLEPVVLDILRLGAYQLEEMRSVPPYAAVSQSVELARAAGLARVTGLVNGVLQSYSRSWESVVFPAFEREPVASLSTWGSHPRWLVERWAERWGVEETAALVESNNQRPELFFTPIAPVQEAIERLAAQGIPAEPLPGFPDSVRITSSHGPEELLAAEPGVIQDPAAASVARFASFPASETVLDLCSAPGGKTIGLARRSGFVIACDLSLRRIRRVASNLARLDLEDQVALVVADGRNPPFRQVSHVLLDAPCSGTGTLRRHVDGRWRITPHDLAALTALQSELLAAAAKIVAPGGTLVYATCSLEAEENEERVEEFLATHPGFRLMAPDPSFNDELLAGDYLRILPQRHGVDGAFSARLERIG